MGCLVTQQQPAGPPGAPAADSLGPLRCWPAVCCSCHACGTARRCCGRASPTPSGCLRSSCRTSPAHPCVATTRCELAAGSSSGMHRRDSCCTHLHCVPLSMPAPQHPLSAAAVRRRVTTTMSWARTSARAVSSSGPGAARQRACLLCVRGALAACVSRLTAPAVLLAAAVIAAARRQDPQQVWRGCVGGSSSNWRQQGSRQQQGTRLLCHRCHAHAGLPVRTYMCVCAVTRAGTFGRVLECWDRKHKDYVAVKIVRNVDKYRHAAMIEVRARLLLRPAGARCGQVRGSAQGLPLSAHTQACDAARCACAAHAPAAGGAQHAGEERPRLQAVSSSSSSSRRGAQPAST